MNVGYWAIADVHRLPAECPKAGSGYSAPVLANTPLSSDVLRLRQRPTRRSALLGGLANPPHGLASDAYVRTSLDGAVHRASTALLPDVGAALGRAEQRENCDQHASRSTVAVLTSTSGCGGKRSVRFCRPKARCRRSLSAYRQLQPEERQKEDQCNRSRQKHADPLLSYAKPTPNWISALPFPMRPTKLPPDRGWLNCSIVASDAEHYGQSRQKKRHHFPADMHADNSLTVVRS